MPIYLMLAMQAAGMITDYLGTKNQTEMMNMGLKVQQAGIDANIEQSRLETADASLQGMKNLRQTLGSQIAVMAARGTATNAGSAALALNQSQGTFNSDERVRQLNQLGRENQLRAGKVMTALQNSSDVSKLWSGFASRTFSTIPTSASAWSQAGSGMKQGFGLTSIKGAS